jgi:hypothetical protein
LHPLSRYSITWTTPPALFALVVLNIGSHFFPRLAWPESLCFRVPTIAGMTANSSCPPFFHWDGISPTSSSPLPLAGLDLELWSFWSQPPT